MAAAIAAAGLAACIIGLGLGVLFTYSATRDINQTHEESAMEIYEGEDPNAREVQDEKWYFSIWDQIVRGDLSQHPYPKTQSLNGKYTWGMQAFTMAEQDLIDAAHTEALAEDLLKFLSG